MAMAKYEFDWCICDKVMACTSVGVRRQRRRNKTHNAPEIVKFRGYNYICILIIFHIIPSFAGKELGPARGAGEGTEIKGDWMGVYRFPLR